MNTSRFFQGLKRHTFFFAGVCVVLIALGASGWGMSHSPQAARSLLVWTQSHELTLFTWRLTLYVSVFLLWKPFVKKRFDSKKTIQDDVKLLTLIGYRRWLVVGTVLIELFIVQNAMSVVIGML